MNTYVFCIQYENGWLDEYETCAINKIMAYDMLTEFLKDTNVNPETVTIIDIEVHAYKEEEQDGSTCSN